MEVNGTTQNNDESNFSEDQTFGLNDDQTGVMTSNEMQSVGDCRTSSGSSSLSNVNNTLNSEQNVNNVLNESGSLDTDVVLIQSQKLLRNANITSTSSSAKGSTDATNNDNNSAIGGSFLKNLFEINGPAYQSINELLEKYPYLPYYSLFSLLTASTGRESVERMLEWTRSLQAKQVATTEGLIKSKEYETETHFLNAYESDDDNTQVNARAGISPSGGPSNIDTSNKCVKIIIIILVIVAVVAISVAVGVLAAGAAGIGLAAAGESATLIGVAVGGGTFVALSVICMAIGMAISGIVSAVSKEPSTRAKVKEYCDLLNPTNAVAELVVMVADLFIDDEETLQRIRLIARIIFAAILIALSIFYAIAGACAVLLILIVSISGALSGLLQIAQGLYTLSTLEKQKNVAKRRLELETAIAYCEKLQKDLDIIASEIDMIVELFTAAMDRIRAEYDRISRMIKETSDVKNMIARNIGA